VPSVATTSAWVSPRVNSAEPWVRGSMPTSDDDRAHRVKVAAVDAAAWCRGCSSARSCASTSLNTADRAAPCRTSLSTPSGARASRRPCALAAATALSRRSLAGRSRRRRAGRPRRRPECGLLDGGVVGRVWKSRGSLAARSASSMMASITGWKPLWPNITAPSMTSSGSSWASDSTISTASCGAGDDEIEARVLHLVDASG